MSRIRPFLLVAALIALPLAGCSSSGAALLRQIAQAIASIADQAVVSFDARRTQVAPGQERNINWDGAAVTVLTNGMTADFPPTLFRDGAGDRQIIVGGVTGETVAVSEDSFATLPGGGANASAGGGFAPLTGTANFTVFGSDTITVSFTTVDTAVAGLVHGFSAVFTDVEVAGRSGLRFFDREGNLLLDVRALALGSGQHQLVGAVFDTAVVATVIIDLGDNRNFGAGAENPGAGGDDYVVLDDFRFFLSALAVPATDFVATVLDIADAPLGRFDRRRLPLAQGQERNINWDGAAVTVLTNGQSAAFPPTLFRDGAGDRQIIVGGVTGENPIVSEDEFATALASGAGAGGLVPLTGTVNFAGIGGTNTVTVSFTTPDTAEAGLVHGFGAIFTDVEVADRSGLRFFDRDGNLIRDVRAQALGNGEHQFVGAIFNSAVVASVVIDMGDNGNFAAGVEDPIGGGDDFIAVDDFRFFQSQTPVPPTTFVAPVLTREDAVFARFDMRRLPLALGQERNINWDGAAVTVLTNGATADFPPDLFLAGAGLRQIVIGDPGQLVAVSENAFSTAPVVQGPEPSPSFRAFTSPVNFAVLQDGELAPARATVRFFLADQVTPALVHGFGAVFTDVEVENKCGLRFFDDQGNLLLNVRAVRDPNGANGISQFVGALFASAQVARVEMDLGDTDPPADLAVLDDILFFMGTVPAVD